MPRRIDIELTSARDDGSWTWRAAGAREPRGTLDGRILPAGATAGQVLRAEVEGHLDGIEVVSVLPPRSPRAEPERLELRPRTSDQPLVTSTLAPRRSGERSRRRGDRGSDERTRERHDGGRRGRSGGHDDGRRERASRPAPTAEDRPRPRRLRPGRAHRNQLLEAVPAEQRPIVEQLLAGGIPAVRQAIDKQNAELKAEGKPEVKHDALLHVAEELRPRVAAAVWRDRAEAAVAAVDDLDLRDLRSVVNAAGDAGRDDEAKALAAQLREALANRVEKEHADWLAELGDNVRAGRVVRALRLSSRPPKAGAPIPGDIATQLAEATAASLTADTAPDRWATVLDALAYSPVRRRVIPQSLPEKLAPDLRATIARLATRLPEIAHIFDIAPEAPSDRPPRGPRRRPGGNRPGSDRNRGKDGGEGRRRGDRSPGAPSAPADEAAAVPGTGEGAPAPADEAAAVPGTGEGAPAPADEAAAVPGTGEGAPAPAGVPSPSASGPGPQEAIRTEVTPLPAGTTTADSAPVPGTVTP